VNAPDPSYLEAQSTLERLARVGAPVRRPDAARPATGAADAPTAPPAAVPQTWSEQTLRQLLESLPDAMIVIDRRGAIVLLNAQAEALFGYPRQELLGRAVEVLVPERFRRDHVAQRDDYFAAPRVRPMGAGMDLYGRHRNGAEFPVEISLSPLQTEHDTLVTAVIRDVSRRKREEAKFRTLIETIPAVTFIAPLDETVPEFYVSPQIENLLGFSQQEWLEDPVLWHRQLHPEDRARWNVQFAPTCAEGTTFRSDYRFVAKDGRVVWVYGSAQMVRGADGQPLFLQGVAFDITPIKQAEEAERAARAALHQLNAELERRVQERTEELAQSMAELQEKTEELEQFAYVASHDLREPLRTLVNYPQRLAKQYGGQFDAQAAEWLARITSGADRMRRLIDSLAHYSRVLRRDRSYAPVDCAAVVQEARTNLQAALEESRAELVVGDLPTVQGNQPQLMLLFQNLIGNAVKFRAADRPARVEVGARRHGPDWLLWVRDNGIGIEAKFLQRIFGLGERLHSASKYAGTGFGLAICEKIVNGHGGRIWVGSTPDHGSAFYFTLRDPPSAPEA
jgi:PAS domain S-box-containing protein